MLELLTRKLQAIARAAPGQLDTLIALKAIAFGAIDDASMAHYLSAMADNDETKIRFIMEADRRDEDKLVQFLAAEGITP